MEYRVVLTNGQVKEVHNPAHFPAPQSIERVEEPYVRATIVTPSEFIGPLMELCQDRRGIFINMEYLTPERAQLVYEMPLNEILMDFYDRLKTCSWVRVVGLQPTATARAIGQDGRFMAGEPVGALSAIVRRTRRTPGGGWREARKSFRGAVRSAIRPPSAQTSRRPSRRCAKTCWPNATAAT